MTTKSLYEQLGKKSGITKIVDDAVTNHMNNPTVNARFIPYLENPKKLAEIKKHSVEFFCVGSGGSEIYHGKNMDVAHKGMNISASEYMYVMDDIFDALDKNGIGEATKKDVLAILWSLKGMIISK